MGCISNVSHGKTSARLPNHSHREHEIIYIHRGSLQLETAQGLLDIDRPTLISIGNLEKHALRSKQDYERFVVTLKPEHFPPDEKQLSLFFLPQFQVLDVSDDAQNLYCLFSMLQEEFVAQGQQSEGGCILLLQTILLRLLRGYPECFPTGGSGIMLTVRRVQALLQRDLDKEITLQQLEQKYHTSAYYLAHHFKRMTGYSIGQYRMLYKMRVACDLLANTDSSISQICEKIGFGDMSNFSRQFKKCIGTTPTQYRKRKLTEKGAGAKPTGVFPTPSSQP